jgi:hypothetical protein
VHVHVHMNEENERQGSPFIPRGYPRHHQNQNKRRDPIRFSPNPRNHSQPLTTRAKNASTLSHLNPANYKEGRPCQPRFLG